MNVSIRITRLHCRATASTCTGDGRPSDETKAIRRRDGGRSKATAAHFPLVQYWLAHSAFSSVCDMASYYVFIFSFHCSHFPSPRRVQWNNLLLPSASTCHSGLFYSHRNVEWTSLLCTAILYFCLFHSLPRPPMFRYPPTSTPKRDVIISYVTD